MLFRSRAFDFSAFDEPRRIRHDLYETFLRLRTFEMDSIDIRKWTLPTSLTTLKLHDCALEARYLSRFMLALGSLFRLHELLIHDLDIVDADYTPPTHDLPQLSLPMLRWFDFRADDEQNTLPLLLHLSFTDTLGRLHLSLDGRHCKNEESLHPASHVN